MECRLDGRVALVVGAGQTAGTTVGNGRACAILYARAGATVVAADRDSASAEETVRMIAEEGGTAVAVSLDVTREDEIVAAVETCERAHGRLDILHNNVGVSLAGGDADVTDIAADAFDRITAINLRSMVLTCKHALPVMKRQGAGVITNISSTAVHNTTTYVAYKTSKAGVVALTQNVAIVNAPFGIRANVILPGLLDTPMAIENRIGILGEDREAVRAARQSQVPLKDRVGTGWDVASASVFLASDQAGYITGVSLIIDGGRSLKVG